MKREGMTGPSFFILLLSFGYEKQIIPAVLFYISIWYLFMPEGYHIE
jgi:hypothetical protein